ncbi:hypothetical protein TNCV_3337911 [Trichonephila clavipes]|nr:hypothetical protein TNCV_3337911 [Trichonephila clavipes]
MLSNQGLSALLKTKPKEVSLLGSAKPSPVRRAETKELSFLYRKFSPQPSRSKTKEHNRFFCSPRSKVNYHLLTKIATGPAGAENFAKYPIIYHDSKLTTILQSKITSLANVSCTTIGPPHLKPRLTLQAQVLKTKNIRIPDRG